MFAVYDGYLQSRTLRRPSSPSQQPYRPPKKSLSRTRIRGTVSGYSRRLDEACDVPYPMGRQSCRVMAIWGQGGDVDCHVL